LQDLLIDLFPMHGDALRSSDPNSNLIALHTQDCHPDVVVDVERFACSPSEDEHGWIRPL
jgi:hypothetical protein